MPYQGLKQVYISEQLSDLCVIIITYVNNFTGIAQVRSELILKTKDVVYTKRREMISGNIQPAVVTIVASERSEINCC
jgi:hypothetical protein